MDDLVKQRLVGSIVLAVLAVLLIPWMFGNPHDPRDTIQASFEGTPIPLKAKAEEVSLVSVAPASPVKPAPRPQPQATAAPRRYLSPPQSVAPTAKPTAAATPGRQASTTPATSTSTAVNNSWTLQLISYNSKASADEFRAKLSRDGYVAWREEVKLKGKSYYRVRMKVRGSKSQALELKKKLEKKYRIQAKLIG